MKTLIRAVVTSFFRKLRAVSGYSPPEWLFKHLHFVGPFEIALPDGQRVAMYSWGNRVENELAWRGWDGHEPNERRVWAALVAGGGDILDIGANTASFAILAKALRPDSRVIAFEPVKRIAEMARKNIATSGLSVDVVSVALARASGELPIYDPGGKNAYSASLDPEFLPGTKQSYLVPVVSLDGFCAERNARPTVVKLDVEGFEGEVLCGAGHILEQGECVFLCEWLGASPAHEEARTLLRMHGYRALSVEDCSEVDLADSQTYSERNVVLVSESKLPHVADIMQNAIRRRV